MNKWKITVSDTQLTDYSSCCCMWLPRQFELVILFTTVARHENVRYCRWRKKWKNLHLHDGEWLMFKRFISKKTIFHWISLELVELVKKFRQKKIEKTLKLKKKNPRNKFCQKKINKLSKKIIINFFLNWKIWQKIFIESRVGLPPTDSIRKFLILW